MTKEEYNQSNAINYSLLSALATHPRKAKAYLDGIREESSYFTFGTLVDDLMCILLDKTISLEQQEDKVLEKYCIADFKIPEGKLGDAVRLLENSPSPISDDSMLIALNTVDWNAGWKANTRIEKIKPLVQKLEEIRLIKGDKILISVDDFELATKLCDNLLKLPILDKALQSEDCIIHIHQRYEVDWQSVKIKSELDVLLEYPSEKLLIPLDIKTTHSINDFAQEYRKYHYYIQGSLYDDVIVRHFLHEQSEKYKDYTIELFTFLVGDSTTGEADTFQMSQTDIERAMFGSPGGFVGIAGLIDLLTWHKETNNWEHTKEWYANGNKNILNVLR